VGTRIEQAHRQSAANAGRGTSDEGDPALRP
jgi:hypothetical protein